MRLKVKDINVTSGGPFVAILNNEDAKELDLYALDRIKIKKSGRELTVVADISTKGIKKGEIGLFEEVLKDLKLREGSLVDVFVEEKPESIYYIKKKMQGKVLSSKEIDAIIKDIVLNRLSVVETTYFVSACYINKMDLNETVALANAIVNHSSQLRLDKKIIVDKHSTGGVAGNRTSMIITPIIAAAGLMMPKTSSRAITTSSGTADTFETLAPVALSIKKIREVVKKTNACIVWGGTKDLASADDKLINIERPLALDPEGILLASIMAKKKAVGATRLLIDVPVGRGAKIQNKKRAKRLRSKFLKLGRKLGIKTKVTLTDGTQPIGFGVGPILECRDVLSILKGGGPDDLKEKSLRMASILLEMAGFKNGKKLASEILYSGKAYRKFKEIIKAQGGNPNVKINNLLPGFYSYNVRSPKNGVVKHIDNSLVNRIARLAGAPRDKGAGLYLQVKKNAKVKKGGILYIVYSENKTKLDYVKKMLKKIKVVEVG